MAEARPYELTGVVGAIYDAALSSLSWPELLRRVGGSLKSVSINLMVRDIKPEEVAEDESGEEDSEDGDSPPRHQLRVRIDGAQSGPQGTGDAPRSVVLGCFVSRDTPGGSLVAIEPGGDIGPGGGENRLGLLAPHLRRAFEIHKQVASLNTRQVATKHVLDHFPVGVLLVDARARVLTMNTTAEAIFAEADGFHVARGGVRSESPTETRDLRDLIAAAADGKATHGGGAMTITRPSSKRPLWLLVTHLRDSGDDDGEAPEIVALFVSDPDRRHEIPAGALEHIFGLTPAETRLLEALVNGKSLEEISEEFQVSKNTLRTQLHQIFRKTDTSRQSEVIKLVLSTPVHLGSSGA